MIRKIRIIVVVVTVVSAVSFFEKVVCWRERGQLLFFANILVLERFVNNSIFYHFLSLSVVPVQFVDTPCIVSPGSKISSRGTLSSSFD